MITINKLANVLKLLQEAGLGDQYVDAYDGSIFLVKSDAVEKNSELGQKLSDAGAELSAAAELSATGAFLGDDGWVVFV